MAISPLPRRTALSPRVLTVWLLKAVAVAALAVDAAIHAELAPDYDPYGAAISQGTLFRAEAAVACLAALLLLLAARRRAVWAFAFLVSASALGAVLLYSHVDVGTLGPLPNMYEPAWYPKKTATAIAEAVGTAAALAGFLATRPGLPTRLRRPPWR
ncbi:MULTISPECIES: hypothetical protein [unclassified Kitasatospora]|uniref:hypothetical protein n=1 Tax=unclassified Kitasatospora TaxID=2633591 RepID=UPI0033F6276F